MTYPGYETYPGPYTYPGDDVVPVEGGDDVFENRCAGIIADPAWLQEMWIGKPGNMWRLPPPDRTYSGQLRRGEVKHTLISGGTAVTRRRKTKRGWQLTFPWKMESDAQLIRALYLGSFGPGPFNFYDPAARNQMELQTSLAGAGSNTVPSTWNVSVGTLAPNTSETPPVLGSGVIQWSGATVNAQLDFNNSIGLLPPTNPIPWFEGRKMTFSVFVKTTGGTMSVLADILDCDALSPGVLKKSITITAVSSVWTRIVVPWDMTTDTGAVLARPMVIPRMVAKSTGATLLISAPQLEYIRDETVRTSTPWVPGMGAAKVNLGDPLDGDSNYFWFRDYDLKLDEV